MTEYTELANSSFLDFDSWRSGTSTLPNGNTVENFSVNVALVFDRANDPTALLESNWASRAKQLDALNDSGTLWTTYGANQSNYDAAKQALHDMGIYTFADDRAPAGSLEIADHGYVSTAESRTLWVHLEKSSDLHIDQFATLFGGTILKETAPNNWFWQGNLSLPTALTALGVKGLWFDSGNFKAVVPNGVETPAAPMPQGWQSPGNATTSPTDIPSQQIAAYYNFPFKGALWDPASGIAPQTGAIGLVEPKVGTAVPGGSFDKLLDHFRSTLGINTPAEVVDVAKGGQQYPTDVSPQAFNPAGERSLDIGVVTAINPQSKLVVYAGSGIQAGAQSNAFTAYQSAFWDITNNPEVITSSFASQAQVAPNSPFYFATSQLFIDAALRNITVFSSNGDGGSGDKFANGLPNNSVARSSPYDVMVGGTAFSTVKSAMADETLGGIVSQALAGDPGVLWTLIAGGLTEMPSAANPAAALIETVWNNYYLSGNQIASPKGKHTGFLENNTGSGGVDTSQPTPWFQTAFGLNPTTSDPSHGVGRGVPDVSANAGGNMFYVVPDPTMTKIQSDDGTSAATPLWASLASQINVIFKDQGLPKLGYATDLLYIAAAIAPGAFNDITLGHNTSSFVMGGHFESDGSHVTPTGFGYYAGPGYDLVSGLGTPNGVLLARALTAIAHTQMTGTSPAMLDSDKAGGWKGGNTESLMFQAMSDDGAHVHVHFGGDDVGFGSFGSALYAWTSRMAQQAMQSDFDPNLVRLFDKQGLGLVGQSDIKAGQGLSVTIDGASAHAIQGSLTSDFGFADFMTDTGVVRVARPVAVAETAGGKDDQTAIVRLRQNGEDSLSVKFYKVDDFTGTIDGKRPGDVGYQAAADARSFELTTGGKTLDGPGYGNFAQSGLKHVNQGDLIAMELFNNTTGGHYWAFAHANEIANGHEVGHLWNYGLNTYGWEDQHGGGDHDYNDLIVQLDFTSASGKGWLA